MTENEEKAYVDGGNATWRHLLGEAIRHLSGTETDVTAARLLTERHDARVALRALAAEVGVEEVDPELHLADLVQRIARATPKIDTAHVVAARIFYREGYGMTLGPWSDLDEKARHRFLVRAAQAIQDVRGLGKST